MSQYFGIDFIRVKIMKFRETQHCCFRLFLYICGQWDILNYYLRKVMELFLIKYVIILFPASVIPLHNPAI